MASATEKKPSPGPSDDSTHVIDDLGLEKDSPIDYSSNSVTLDTPVDDLRSHDQDQAKSQHKSSVVATLSPYVPPK